MKSSKSSKAYSNGGGKKDSLEILTPCGCDFIQPQTHENKLNARHNNGTDSSTSSREHLNLVLNNEIQHK